MKYAACRVPAAPVYREPTHKSELINQLLFGETMEVLEDGGKFWARIKGHLDGYEGWVARGQLEEMSQAFLRLPQVPTVKQPFTLVQVEGQRSMLIPFGASLLGYGALAAFTTVRKFLGEVLQEELHKREEPFGEPAGFNSCFGRFKYTYKAATAKTPALRALIGAWLDAPYLWGGRTVLGVDCSGFAQTIYKVMGIRIARDAHQQALQGHPIGFLQEAEPGDLAFFDNEEGQIIHVGILLSENEIVHAAGGTGKVQIDHIDNEGIVRSDNGERTHRLRVIKRFFSGPISGVEYMTRL